MSIASINKAKILTFGEIIRGKTVETAHRNFKSLNKSPLSIQTDRTKILPNGNIKRQFMGYLEDDSFSLQTKVFKPDFSVSSQSAGTRSAKGDTVAFATKNEHTDVNSPEFKTLWEKAQQVINDTGLNIL